MARATFSIRAVSRVMIRTGPQYTVMGLRYHVYPLLDYVIEAKCA
jgi:hypothetical protein